VIQKPNAHPSFGRVGDFLRLGSVATEHLDECPVFGHEHLQIVTRMSLPSWGLVALTKNERDESAERPSL